MLQAYLNPNHNLTSTFWPVMAYISYRLLIAQAIFLLQRGQRDETEQHSTMLGYCLDWRR